MDFIDEKNRRSGLKERLTLGALNDFTHVLHSAVNGREGEEGEVADVGNDFGERGLPHPRRSPKDEGGDASPVQHAAQDAAFADKVFLSDVVVQSDGTKSFC